MTKITNDQVTIICQLLLVTCTFQMMLSLFPDMYEAILKICFITGGIKGAFYGSSMCCSRADVD